MARADLGDGASDVGLVHFVELTLLALALAADAASVGAAVGLTHRRWRQILRLSFHFGAFQALMPLFGALGGRGLRRLVGPAVSWLAGIVLVGLGAKFLLEGAKETRVGEAATKDSLQGPDSGAQQDMTRGWNLVALSVAVSIDALAGGFLLGARELPIVASVLYIGLVTFLATIASMVAAARFGRLLGRWAGVVGGLVLVGLGILSLPW